MAACIAVGIALLPFTGQAEELIVNGSFNNALTGWSVSGAVAASGGLAVVTDNNASYSLLHQLLSVPDGFFTLEFDFRNVLSGTVPPGQVADAAFATLYFTNDVQSFNIPGNTFDASINLFDLEAAGPFNVHPNAVIFATPGRPNFFTFQLTFANEHTALAPAFELFALNGINDDSAWAIDDVSLVQVPEPGSSWLALGGVAMGYACFGRREVWRS